MPETPKGTGSQERRSTRSNSTQSLTLCDIKDLIEKSKKEIIHTFRNEIERLNTKLNELENKVISLEGENKLLIERNQNINKELTKLQSRDVVNMETITQEMDDRMFRRPNLILSGIPESAGSVEDRKNKDKEIWSKVCAALGMEEAKEVDDLRRIGKVQTRKPRLLRVVCRNASTKFAILKKAKQLKTVHELKGIYINPDRTRTEQEMNRLLQEELKRRRNAGENVAIYRNRVVLKSDVRNFQD